MSDIVRLDYGITKRVPEYMQEDEDVGITSVQTKNCRAYLQIVDNYTIDGNIFGADSVNIDTAHYPDGVYIMCIANTPMWLLKNSEKCTVIYDGIDAYGLNIITENELHIDLYPGVGFYNIKTVGHNLYIEGYNHAKITIGKLPLDCAITYNVRFKKSKNKWGGIK